MRTDIESVLREFYPNIAFESPYAYEGLAARLKAVQEKKEIYKIIGEIRSRVSRDMEHHTAAGGNVSELVFLKDGALSLKLSYLAPFAEVDDMHANTLPAQERQRLMAELRMVLEKFEYMVLTRDELNEEVAWINVCPKVTVRECLFGREGV